MSGDPIHARVVVASADFGLAAEPARRRLNDLCDIPGGEPDHMLGVVGVLVQHGRFYGERRGRAVRSLNDLHRHCIERVANAIERQFPLDGADPVVGALTRDVDDRSRDRCSPENGEATCPRKRARSP